MAAAVLGAAAVLLAATCGWPLAPAWGGEVSAAAPDGDAEVEWSVVPAGEGGPDGRHWFELELDPGGRARELLAVTNLSDHPAVFQLQAADGYFTDKGRYAMLADPSGSEDAGLWIEVQGEAPVAAGQTALVPFEVAVPKDAEPGDHAAGLAAAFVPESAGGGMMGVNARIGVRVMIRVSGELRPALEFRAVDGAYKAGWNPLQPGSVEASFELVNTGNTRLSVTGAAALGGERAAFPASGGIELLPGDSRRVEARLGDVWPGWRKALAVKAEPVVVTTTVGGGPAPQMEPVEAVAGLWVLPWTQAAALLGAALLLWAALAGRSKSRRRRARELARAREEGRAEGLAQQVRP